MSGPRIPNPVAVVVGQVLGAHYYSHRRLNNLFVEKGVPGDRPDGNCTDKCVEWLKRSSADASVDALSIFGGVLEELMEVDRPPAGQGNAALEASRAKVRDVLADEDLVMPPDQSIEPLWKSVQANLGLDPSQIPDDDLKRILSGLTSVVDGLVLLNTSRFGAWPRQVSYKLAARHGRLVVHWAHSGRVCSRDLGCEEAFPAD